MSVERLEDYRRPGCERCGAEPTLLSNVGGRFLCSPCIERLQRAAKATKRSRIRRRTIGL